MANFVDRVHPVPRLHGEAVSPSSNEHFSKIIDARLRDKPRTVWKELRARCIKFIVAALIITSLGWKLRTGIASKSLSADVNSRYIYYIVTIQKLRQIRSFRSFNFWMDIRENIVAIVSFIFKEILINLKIQEWKILNFIMKPTKEKYQELCIFYFMGFRLKV